MRKLNVYYVVSIISLAFMMLILLRTLEMRGWFDKYQGRTPAEHFKVNVVGIYDLEPIEYPNESHTIIIAALEEPDSGWITLKADSLVNLRFKMSDFEDEQVLVELFRPDTVGSDQRIEGCELLLSADDSGAWSGSTIGESCGYSTNLRSYYSIKLHVATGTIRVEIESLKYDDQTILNRKEYLLKRSEKNE
jgi:hypothetical protein